MSAARFKQGEVAITLSENGARATVSVIRATATSNQIALITLAGQVIAAIANDEPIAEFLARAEAAP